MEADRAVLESITVATEKREGTAELTPEELLLVQRHKKELKRKAQMIDPDPEMYHISKPMRESLLDAMSVLKKDLSTKEPSRYERRADCVAEKLRLRIN